MQLVVILAIVVATLGVVFALQNNVPVTVTFLLWRFDSSLAMVLLIALGLGAVIVALVSVPATLRSKWALSRHRREISRLKAGHEHLEGQIAELSDRNGRERGTGEPPAGP